MRSYVSLVKQDVAQTAALLANFGPIGEDNVSVVEDQPGVRQVVRTPVWVNAVTDIVSWKEEDGCS